MRIIATTLIMLTTSLCSADELTRAIETDLVALGYETGLADGEETLETTIAISKFQAENNLDITGEVSPQLATALRNVRNGASATAASESVSQADLQTARQACLEDRVAAAQASQKKKRGLGSLVRAVANTAGRFGGSDFSRDMAKATHDIYDADATARDWKRAAKDLGLTEDDISACENPK